MSQPDAVRELRAAVWFVDVYALWRWAFVDGKVEMGSGAAPTDLRARAAARRALADYLDVAPAVHVRWVSHAELFDGVTSLGHPEPTPFAVDWRLDDQAGIVGVGTLPVDRDGARTCTMHVDVPTSSRMLKLTLRARQ